MDSLGILGEVLECSICLETLDSSSRVLPCQHTFCKACLLDVLSTHKELRCPECRTLVTVPFESLLPNILLMRILEGMKTFPWTTKKEEETRLIDRSTENVAPLSSFVQEPLPATYCSQQDILYSSSSLNSNVSTDTTSTNQQPDKKNLNPFFVLAPEVSMNDQITPTPVTAPQAPDDLLVSNSQNPVMSVQAQALFNYEQKDQRDLSFKKGDVMMIVKKIDDNWYHCKLNDAQGIVPASYIKIIEPATVNVPLCKALYDFKVRANEDNNCLAFSKGDVITLLRKIDDNWVEGKLDSRIGIFPLCFVKLNNAAREFLKLSLSDQADDDFHATPSTFASFSTTTPAATTCHSSLSVPTVLSTVPQVSPSSTNETQQEPLFNSESSLNCFDDFFSPSPPTESRNSNRSSTNLSPTPNESNKRSNSSELKKEAVDKGKPNLVARLRGMSNLKIYIALFAYQPRKADELELAKGRLYTVTEKCHDGWFKGQCISTDKVGVFPGNYVQMAKAQTTPAYISRFTTKKDSINEPIIPLLDSSTKTTSNEISSIKRSPNNAELGVLMRCSNAPPELPPRQYSTKSSRVSTVDSMKSSQQDYSSSSPSTNGLEKGNSNSGGTKFTKKSSKSTPQLFVENPVFETKPGVVMKTSYLKSGPIHPNVSPKHFTHPAPLVMERFRCIVAYPPNGTDELELKIGDVVYIHKKHDDGWFKGTLQRTGKTGLFPACFVEPG